VGIVDLNAEARNMDRTALTIDGMNCDHCVRAVTRALQRLDGLEVEKVEIGSATVAYDAGRLNGERIRGVIEDEGYTVRGMETFR
jgi:copper chaperone